MIQIQISTTLIHNMNTIRLKVSSCLLFHFCYHILLLYIVIIYLLLNIEFLKITAIEVNNDYMI